MAQILTIEEHQTDNVATPSIAYLRAAVHWDIIHDLQGGTRAMRRAGRKWLPQEEAESDESFSVRLERTVLFEGYNDAVARLVSKPFPKPITIQEADALPEQLQEIEANADGMGRSLTNFAADLFEAGIHYGVVHIIPDFPQVPEGATLADERRMGARPAFNMITAPDLVGFRSINVGGAEIPTQLRVKERAVVDVGAYGQKEVERIRVWNAPTIDPNNEFMLGTWELWEEQSNDLDVEERWVMIDQNTHTYPGVPITSFYVNRTGYLEGEPAMEALAWTNILHWQSTSDQRNILRFSRVGILFASGFTSDEIKNGIVVGPTRVVKAKSDKASLKYVEHTGKAIEYGAKDIADLEDKMQFLGMLPLLRRSGNKTATEKTIDEAKAQNDVQTWVRNLETTLMQAYEIAATWLGVDLPAEFKIDIFNDFGLSMGAGADMEVLTKARERGDISHETFLKELKRRGVLPEDLIVDDEVKAADKEAEDELARNADAFAAADALPPGDTDPLVEDED